eukprot:312964-Lingulodinium_polyedra.AAC.1
MAQPGTSARCSRSRWGAGHAIATPPCLPPRGPSRASEAATRVCGMRPAFQAAAAGASQCASWRRATASAAT